MTKLLHIQGYYFPLLKVQKVAFMEKMELENNYLDEKDPWKGILSATAFAVRATFHTTLQQTLGQVVFGRDMIFNIQHTANWEYIKQRKQKIINQNNQNNQSNHHQSKNELFNQKKTK